jgi:hypothetical protein
MDTLPEVVDGADAAGAAVDLKPAISDGLRGAAVGVGLRFGDQEVVGIGEGRLLPEIGEVVVGCECADLLEQAVVVQLCHPIWGLIVQPYAPPAAQTITLVHNLIIVEIQISYFITIYSCLLPPTAGLAHQS